MGIGSLDFAREGIGAELGNGMDGIEIRGVDGAVATVEHVDIVGDACCNDGGNGNLVPSCVGFGKIPAARMLEWNFAWLVGVNRTCGGGIRLVVEICGDEGTEPLTSSSPTGTRVGAVAGWEAGLDQRLAVGIIRFVGVDTGDTGEVPPSLSTLISILQLSTLF